MDKQIHEVYTFFKEKIIAGQYTLVGVDSATATVEIHGHNFVIWIKNGAFGVSTYNGSFMNIEFSETEKESAWAHLIDIQRDRRKILFRGLTGNGEWVYGDLHHDLPYSTAYYNDYSQRICWRPESGGEANAPVKNGTVGQFTGLLDKNGNRIFEGDVYTTTRARNNQRFVVYFKNGSFCGCRTDVDRKKGNPLGFIIDEGQDEMIDSYWYSTELEVIGNIHDNASV